MWRKYVQLILQHAGSVKTSFHEDTKRSAANVALICIVIITLCMDIVFAFSTADQHPAETFTELVEA